MKSAFDVLQHFLKDQCLFPLIKSAIDLVTAIVKNAPKTVKKGK